MASQRDPAWIGTATAGADRLAAEAVSHVDEILEHADASPDRLADQVVRLEQSADPGEVAADLAGLLWADCEDVPPIATILGEPAAQGALGAVSDARRLAARRLAAAIATAEGAAPADGDVPGDLVWDAPEPAEEHHSGPAPDGVPAPPAASAG